MHIFFKKKKKLLHFLQPQNYFIIQFVSFYDTAGKNVSFRIWTLKNGSMKMAVKIGPHYSSIFLFLNLGVEACRNIYIRYYNTSLSDCVRLIMGGSFILGSKLFVNS